MKRVFLFSALLASLPISSAQAQSAIELVGEIRTSHAEVQAVVAQQFEPALRTIEADLRTAESFVTEARSYKLPDGAIQTLVDAVEGKKVTLTRVKTRLESESWQKRFQVQTTLAKRYGSIGVADITTYRFAEAAYKAVYNACARRQP